MQFKIKDNVKLNLLEELGFDYNGIDTYSIEYEGTYIMMNKEDKILNHQHIGIFYKVISYDNEIKKEGYNYVNTTYRL